jgi:hypothetical protein
MKVSIYIEKKEFNTFFVWVNRINQGIISKCPTQYSESSHSFREPVQILLTADEYAVIQDIEDDIKSLETELGGELVYTPEPLENDKIVINNILKNAQRHDVEADLVNTALELIGYIPGITPLEALIIAEREWLNVGKEEPQEDI